MKSHRSHNHTELHVPGHVVRVTGPRINIWNVITHVNFAHHHVTTMTSLDDVNVTTKRFLGKALPDWLFRINLRFCEPIRSLGCVTPLSEPLREYKRGSLTWDSASLELGRVKPPSKGLVSGEELVPERSRSPEKEPLSERKWSLRLGL